MKLIIVFGIVFTTAAAAIASRPLVDLSKIKVDNNMSMEEMFQSIVKDQKFLALDISKQLHVLIVIYDILEFNCKKMMKEAKNGKRKERISNCRH
jgi:hypothetical protein